MGAENTDSPRSSTLDADVRFLYSRMMREEFLGQPIIDLEKARKETWMVRQAPPERLLYRAVEERFRELLNEHLPKDDVRKSLTYMICQMTPLRQSVP